jgi:hypothetical protein
MTRSEEVLEAIDAIGSANRLVGRDLAMRVLLTYALSQLGYLRNTPAAARPAKHADDNGAGGF